MKDSLRAPLLEIIAGLKAQGLELGGDIASVSITYPEHPEIMINISIGGLLYDAVEPEEGGH